MTAEGERDSPPDEEYRASVLATKYHLSASHQKTQVYVVHRHLPQSPLSLPAMSPFLLIFR